MKVICHGIDLVDCDRIDQMLSRHEDRFLERVFTLTEQEYSQRHRDRTERLAGRFAVKEAVMKMIGTGWSEGAAWKDVETINNSAGKPEVKLSGEIARLAREMGIDHISVSITHAKGLAVASAIALGDE
ncbi:MAG: holo-ACP synthase [Sedimentisphaerales bacterium]|nr:holo-ACP synthase [Sedimentisphaerales bacterium]